MQSKEQDTLESVISKEEQAVSDMQRLFMDFINKSRKIYDKIYKNDPDSVDSEVSINTHAMMHEFDKYRTRRKEG